MNRAISIVSGVALILAASGSAFAADLYKPVYKAPPLPPPAPVYSWTGLYVGANAGYAWGHSNLASNFTCPVPGQCDYILQPNVDAFSSAGTGTLSPNGFTGGGQVGYNYQSGQF